MPSLPWASSYSTWVQRRRFGLASPAGATQAVATCAQCPENSKSYPKMKTLFFTKSLTNVWRIVKWKTFLDWKLKNSSIVRRLKVKIVLPTYSPPSHKTADSCRPHRQSEEFESHDRTSNKYWLTLILPGYSGSYCTKKSAVQIWNYWLQKDAKNWLKVPKKPQVKKRPNWQEKSKVSIKARS